MACMSENMIMQLVVDQQGIFCLIELTDILEKMKIELSAIY